MRVLVTGANGQLGSDVMTELTRRGHTALACTSAMADIRDREQTRKVLCGLHPDAVIHCAAWTAVDDSEECAEKCRLVNEEGTRNVALACKDAGAKLLYISTDYVFDGQGSTPHRPADETGTPCNVYGRTKLAGERAAAQITEKLFIVRTSWVFGLHGGNFVRTMLRLGKTHPELRVVCDQIGTPTYTRHLARLLVDMAATDRYGTYHAVNGGGYISWYDLACEIFRLTGQQVHVQPVTTREYGMSRAARPLNSRMDTECLLQNGFEPLPDWHIALREFLSELQDEEQ